MGWKSREPAARPYATRQFPQVVHRARQVGDQAGREHGVQAARAHRQRGDVREQQPPGAVPARPYGLPEHRRGQIGAQHHPGGAHSGAQRRQGAPRTAAGVQHAVTLAQS